MNKSVAALGLCIILMIATSCGVRRRISPFMISTLANSTVAKTKDTLDLKMVYHNPDAISLENITFKLISPSSRDFLRYRILKEMDEPKIQILPRVKFERIDDDTFHIVLNDSHIDIDSLVTAEMTIEENAYATIGIAINDQIRERLRKVRISIYNRNGFYCPTEEIGISDYNPSNFYFTTVKAPTSNQKYLATERLLGMPITMPVKFRRLDGSTQITGSFSVGYGFGYRIRVNNNPYKEQYINFIPYAISIQSDKYFTQKTDSTGNKSYTAKEDDFSLTWLSCGLTYEINGFNIGAFIGWDKMFNEHRDWAYQNELWLSLGIGYKFKSGD